MIRAGAVSALAVAVVLGAFGAAWASTEAPRCPRRLPTIRAAPARTPRVTFGEPRIVSEPPRIVALTRRDRPHPPSAPAWRCRWHDEEQGIRSCEFVR